MLVNWLSIYSFIYSPNSLYRVLNKGVSSERVDEVEICFQEAGLIVQQKAETKMLVQNSDC